MLTAVDFDNQLGLIADEVDNEHADLVLSAKLAALKPSVAQLLPQLRFGICLRPAQISFT